MIEVIWEYFVRAEGRAAFEDHYAPEGTWGQLFRRSPAYLGTILAEDVDRPGRFITIDRWQDAESCDAFKKQFAGEYTSLDAHCQKLTTQERCLGVFALAQGGNPATARAR